MQPLDVAAGCPNHGALLDATARAQAVPEHWAPLPLHHPTQVRMWAQAWVQHAASLEVAVASMHSHPLLQWWCHPHF